MQKNTEWKQFRKKLPRFKLDQQFQAKIDEEKASMISLDQHELARNMAREKRKKSMLEEKIKQQNVLLEAYSQLLVSELEGSSIQSLSTTRGESVYISDEPYSSVENRELIFKFIKANRRPDLLSIASNALNKENKERLRSGKPPLPGTKVYLKTRARVKSASQRNGGDDE